MTVMPCSERISTVEVMKTVTGCDFTTVKRNGNFTVMCVVLRAYLLFCLIGKVVKIGRRKA